MRRIAVYLIPTTLVLMACTHRVDVALRPAYQTAVTRSTELAGVQPALNFARGSYSDRRPDTTRLATFKQGMNTYNLYGERPIQDALYDGLQALLTTSGHAWVAPESGKPDLRLDVQLMNFQASRNAGFINVGATSSVQVKVDVVDARTGKGVYTEVYNGTDERSQAMVGLMGMVRASIDASIVNCINNIGKDARLAAALRQPRGT